MDVSNLPEKNKQTNKQKKTNTEWENKFPSVLKEHLPLTSKVTGGQ